MTLARVMLLGLLAGCSSEGAAGNAGPKGDPGLVGAPGMAGAAGTNGNEGAAGANGTMGAAGAMGVQGAAGAAGDAGARGPSGGGIIWRDRLGAVVPVVTWVQGGQIWVADARGNIWQADAAYGWNASQTVNMAPVYYSGAGCTGTAYVPAFGLTPRYVFQAANDPTYRVLADGAAINLGAVTRAFRTNGQPCVDVTSTQIVFALVDTTPAIAITPPAARDSLFAPPAHPEFVP